MRLLSMHTTHFGQNLFKLLQIHSHLGTEIILKDFDVFLLTTHYYYYYYYYY
jgi:hypothetical protein